MSRLLTFFLIIVTMGLSALLAWLGWVTNESNPVGWFLLITGVVYFFGLVIVYWVRRIQFWMPRAKGEMIKEERSDWSFWFIAAGMIAGFYLPPVEYLLFEAILPRGFLMQIPGLSLIVLGSSLFIWARRALGQFYSGHVSVIEGQQLVRSGPYRFIRHPAYAGYILIALGIVLGYSSLAGLTAILFVLLPSVIYRMHVEEQFLGEHFGKQFSEYALRTKHLIPGIW